MKITSRYWAGISIVMALALIILYFLINNIIVERQEITIACTGGIPTSLFWIAENNGYFKDEDLDVRYLDFDQGPPALDALRDGRADLTSSGELPIVRSIIRGDKIYILAEMESDFGKNIIARRDRNINSPADLSGKKIGVTKGTVNEFQLIALLETNGISENDVTLIDVPFADSIKTFNSGTIDAISARQTSITELEKQFGDQGIVFSTEGIYTFRFLVVANQEFTNQHPDIIEKVLRSLVRAEKFAKENPTETYSITADYMQTDPKIIKQGWEKYSFYISLSQPIFITLEDEARWLIERDPDLGRFPNFLDFIYFKGLEVVKPDSVTISHPK
jgi:sulfonate transport system substrate-binding protein